jgi:hypothetical protein
MTTYPEYEGATVDRLHTVLTNIKDRIEALESAENLSSVGRWELSELSRRRTYLQARIAEMVWGEPHRRENPDVIAALQRIMRKAEIMRLDAKTRRDQRVVGDANEIELLARIALRGIGAEHGV